MKAIMIDDEYIDLVPEVEYEITRVFSPCEGYIMLAGSPRRYLGKHHFKIIHNGKEISFAEAYRQYRLDSVKKKLGLSK